MNDEQKIKNMMKKHEDEKHVSMDELLLGCLGGCLTMGVLIGLLLLYFWFISSNARPEHYGLPWSSERPLRYLHPTQSERTLKD